MSESKQEAYKILSKKEYEFRELQSQLEKAKDGYREALVKESAGYILNVLEKEGSLTERDLDIFLNDLSRKIKNLYEK